MLCLTWAIHTIPRMKTKTTVRVNYIGPLGCWVEEERTPGTWNISLFGSEKLEFQKINILGWLEVPVSSHEYVASLLAEMIWEANSNTIGRACRLNCKWVNDSRSIVIWTPTSGFGDGPVWVQFLAENTGSAGVYYSDLF